MVLQGSRSGNFYYSVGSDDTLHVGSNYKLFALFGQTGVKKWEFETDAGQYSQTSIGLMVHVGSYRKLYALNQTGFKKERSRRQ